MDPLCVNLDPRRAAHPRLNGVLPMDGDSLYITSNQFSAGDRFQGVRLLVVPKATVYPDAISGACPAATSI